MGSHNTKKRSSKPGAGASAAADAAPKPGKRAAPKRQKFDHFGWGNPDADGDSDAGADPADNDIAGPDRTTTTTVADGSLFGSADPDQAAGFAFSFGGADEEDAGAGEAAGVAWFNKLTGGGYERPERTEAEDNKNPEKEKEKEEQGDHAGAAPSAPSKQKNDSGAAPASASASSLPPSAATAAVPSTLNVGAVRQYLLAFHTDRASGWKFNKKLQTQLLGHCLSFALVPATGPFNAALASYVLGLIGHAARQKLRAATEAELRLALAALAGSATADSADRSVPDLDTKTESVVGERLKENEAQWTSLLESRTGASSPAEPKKDKKSKKEKEKKDKKSKKDKNSKETDDATATAANEPTESGRTIPAPSDRETALAQAVRADTILLALAQSEHLQPPPPAPKPVAAPEPAAVAVAAPAPAAPAPRKPTGPPQPGSAWDDAGRPSLVTGAIPTGFATGKKITFDDSDDDTPARPEPAPAPPKTDRERNGRKRKTRQRKRRTGVSDSDSDSSSSSSDSD